MFLPSSFSLLLFFVVSEVVFSQSSNTTTSPAIFTPTCISLEESRLCPEYKSWLIPSEFLYNNLTYVRGVGDFDRLVRYLFLQLDVESVQSKQKCPAFKFAFQPRYRITLICSLVLNRPDITRCTPEPQRKLVCSETCYASMQDLQKEILDNPQICPAADRANASSLCPQISSNSTECVTGVHNEPKSCGFLLPEQNEKACRYCLDSAGKDACCNELPDDVAQCVRTSGQATFWSNSNTASAVTSNKLLIGVLIIAGMGWLGLMGLVVWYVRNKREQQMYADQVGAASVYSLARIASAPPVNTEGTTGVVYPPPVYSEKSPHTSKATSGGGGQKKKLPSPLMTSSDCSSVVSSGSALSSLDSPSHASPFMSPSFAAAAAAAGGGGGEGAATYVVRYSYEPQLPDELKLDEGRTIQVLKIFDDGWAIGLDPDTNNEGVFPLACVEPYRVMPPPDARAPSPKPPPSPPLLSVTDVDASDDGYVHRAPRRASSLVPPDSWTTVVTSPVISASAASKVEGGSERK